MLTSVVSLTAKLVSLEISTVKVLLAPFIVLFVRVTVSLANELV
jgi:hypothetical protein